MIIEIQSFPYSNAEMFNKAMKIRFNVFTNELNIDKDLDYDGLDFDAIHYLLLVDNKPVATARWIETDYGIKIERLSILKEFRSFGYSFLLLKHIVYDVIKSNKIIYLHSQKHLIDFFKLAGFYIAGTEFVEFGIPHFKMIYKSK